ncbi:hypothetical protein A2955_05180 [Candidatus Woesebacteria bacterium RIFCSPLOWO2_01_FULL_37_19]|uniref:Uncharacterized protein n=1 Tax=Candidatus Woesebacteria bacterium RIFCSPLOWO2_01_FULL_37_19 TaxID=1802514 RepID=A0A1F8AZB9_9BACT|nr:MAG: hypothetical protein A2955_05180 [Candidatus Woesebacteria bacterium RIFCSPLOWO2_01_FULL_37_19]
MDPAQNNSSSTGVAANENSNTSPTTEPKPISPTASPPVVTNEFIPPWKRSRNLSSGILSQYANHDSFKDTPNPQETPEKESILTPKSMIQDQSNKPKSNKFKLFFLLLLFIFILGAAFAGLVYGVAYEKIKLNKYPDIQKQLSNIVQSIPFMPKTPKFLLAKSALVHKKVTKQSFNASLAIDSDDLAGELGINKIDIEGTGSVDYSDPKNLKIALDASLTKEFNFELRKNDEMLYFKINKLPIFLLALFGLSQQHVEPILDKWIAYDTTPIQTEARKEIEDKEIDSASQDLLENDLDTYLDDKVLEKMKLVSVVEENKPMYKITLAADPELIDHIGKKLENQSDKAEGASLDKISEDQKLSEIVKELDWEIFIDKKEYFTRKIVVDAELEFDQTNFSLNLYEPLNPKQNTKANIVFVIKLNDFGKDITVVTPESVISFEEFSEILSTIIRDIYEDTLKP